MFQIAYRSEAVCALDNADIFRILVRSAENNSRSKLTGFLVYLNGNFFQVLEGQMSDIDLTYQRILADPRHTKIELMHKAAIQQRGFEVWRMRRLRLTDVSEIETTFADASISLSGSPILPLLENFLLDNLAPRGEASAA